MSGAHPLGPAGPAGPPDPAVPASPTPAVGVLRHGLVAVGVVVGLYGAYLTLSRQTSRQIVSTVQYLVGGVVLNDLLIAVAALVVGALVTRALPAAVRAPVVVGAVVLGSITLIAVPVLLSYGRKADNPSLLDRDFVAGWWVFAAVVVVAVVVGVVLRMVAARKVPGSAS